MGGPARATGRAHPRQATLPASWVYNGRPGYYIGHVPPGGTANFAAMNRAAL